MFVQKRADHWLLIEWSNDGRRIRPVILGEFATQQLALDAMAMAGINNLEVQPLARRGFGSR